MIVLQETADRQQHHGHGRQLGMLLEMRVTFGTT
jgi:hypothetical protein